MYYPFILGFLSIQSLKPQILIQIQPPLSQTLLLVEDGTHITLAGAQTWQSAIFGLPARQYKQNMF